MNKFTRVVPLEIEFRDNNRYRYTLEEAIKLGIAKIKGNEILYQDNFSCILID